jgi:flagellar basal-body rod protein FlgG
MNDALYIAATGLQAHQAQMDAVAQNIANLSTPGYKRVKVDFQDMVQRVEASQAEPASVPGQRVESTSTGVGRGVLAARLERSFHHGELRRTDRPLDVALQGVGFIELQSEDGSPAYARGGALRTDAEGWLTLGDGFTPKQRIQVPADVRDVRIAPDGDILAVDENGRERLLGRLELVTFNEPSALQQVAPGIYRASPSAGDALSGVAGEGGLGRFVQGHLEQSNVKASEEFVMMMIAQRGYEMAVKVIQAADELAALTNNLRK